MGDCWIGRENKMHLISKSAIAHDMVLLLGPDLTFFVMSLVEHLPFCVSASQTCSLPISLVQMILLPVVSQSGRKCCVTHSAVGRRKRFCSNSKDRPRLS